MHRYRTGQPRLDPWKAMFSSNVNPLRLRTLRNLRSSVVQEFLPGLNQELSRTPKSRVRSSPHSGTPLDHAPKPRFPRPNGQSFGPLRSIFLHRKRLLPAHVWTGHPMGHPKRFRYDDLPNSDDTRRPFAAQNLRPVSSRQASMLAQKFLIVPLGGFQRPPFAPVRFVSKECGVNFPLARQADKEAVRAPFRLINAGNTGHFSAGSHRAPENNEERPISQGSLSAIGGRVLTPAHGETRRPESI